MPTKYTSALLWADVPDEQREAPATDARALLDLARPQDRREAVEAEILRPIFRDSLRRWQRAEAGPPCPIATRQIFDQKRKVWMYRPCGNPPAEGQERCWRHGGEARKAPGRH